MGRELDRMIRNVMGRADELGLGVHAGIALIRGTAEVYGLSVQKIEYRHPDTWTVHFAEYGTPAVGDSVAEVCTDIRAYGADLVDRKAQ